MSEELDEHPPGLVKISVSFEPDDYAWVVERSRELFGRRGQGMYIRKLVKEDRICAAESKLYADDY